MPNITSWTDLAAISSNMAGSYVQTKNLTPEDNDYVGIGDSWTPLAGDFSGTYNGNGFRIRGMIIDTVPTSNDVGMFESITGSVQNIILVDGSIDISGDLDTDDVYIGALAGKVSGSVNYCRNYKTNITVDVTNGEVFIGGLFGAVLSGVSIRYSYSTGDISFTSDDTCGGVIGGFIGYGYSLIQESYIEQCWATGNVTGINEKHIEAGGFIGFILSNDSHLFDCYSIGNVYVESDNTVQTATDVGGFCGILFSLSFTMRNCYSIGDVTLGTDAQRVGGLIGYAESGGTLSNSYSTGTVSGTSFVYAGGFMGLNTMTFSNDSWYTGAYSVAIGWNTADSSSINLLASYGYGTDISDTTDYYDKTIDVYQAGANDWDFDTPIWYEEINTFPRLIPFIHKINGIENEDIFSVKGVRKEKVNILAGVD